MSLCILLNYTLFSQYAHPVFCSPVKLSDYNINIYLKSIAVEFLYAIDFFNSVIRKILDLFLSIRNILVFMPYTSNAVPSFLLPTISLPPRLPTSVVLSYTVFSVVPYRYLLPAIHLTSSIVSLLKTLPFVLFMTTLYVLLTWKCKFQKVGIFYISFYLAHNQFWFSILYSLSFVVWMEGFENSYLIFSTSVFINFYIISIWTLFWLSLSYFFHLLRQKGL